MLQLKDTFKGEVKVSFHIGSWPFAKKDPITGQLHKRQVGAWMFKVFKIMAKLKFLRGTLLDPFARNAEGKLASVLLAQYESDIALVVEQVAADNIDNAIKLLALPEKIRGFGEIRVKHVDALVQLRKDLRATFTAGKAAYSQNLYSNATIKTHR